MLRGLNIRWHDRLCVNHICVVHYCFQTVILPLINGCPAFTSSYICMYLKTQAVNISCLLYLKPLNTLVRIFVMITTQRMMIGWMCGISLRGRISSIQVRSCTRGWGGSNLGDCEAWSTEVVYTPWTKGQWWLDVCLQSLCGGWAIVQWQGYKDLGRVCEAWTSVSRSQGRVSTGS